MSNGSAANASQKSGEQRLPQAFVMNMYYTGLGIARSLGERGVPVTGLSSKRGVFGNFTRFAKVVIAPDSRSEPEALAEFLVRTGKGLPDRAVIFPTRDDDLVFLDRFRKDLSPYFSLVAPESGALHASLDKWETYVAAEAAGVPAPKCWKVESSEELRQVISQVTYPCVLKAISAHHWRQGANWELVGARKAIAVASERELLQEYDVIAHADRRALIQEMVPGGDDSLVIAACYMDLRSQWAAGFNTQKLLQIPEGFGTGCIVQSVSRPELFERTARILRSLRFTGIAEVEYKWDAAAREFKLIEINPRPWDQHRLGNACGVELMYRAYCDHAGFTAPETKAAVAGHKWIAEDTFLLTAAKLLFRRDGNIWEMFRRARGKRIYAIWSVRDPLPFLVYLTTVLIPELALSVLRKVGSFLKKMFSRTEQKGFSYERRLEK